MSILYSRHFHDEASAYEFLECRLWNEGQPLCPHCRVAGISGRLKGRSTRYGVWKCYGCRKPFTVKAGAIFEGSKVKMHLWLQAILLVVGSEKGISSKQLARVLGVTIKTAWLMTRRIRTVLAHRMSISRMRRTALPRPERTDLARIQPRKVVRRPRYPDRHVATTHPLLAFGGTLVPASAPKRLR